MINRDSEVRGTELVEIWHPDHPKARTRVTRRAFERRSAGLGWLIVDDTIPDPPEATEQPQEVAVDRKTELQRQLDDLGVKYHRNSGVAKLQALLNEATAK